MIVVRRVGFQFLCDEEIGIGYTVDDQSGKIEGVGSAFVFLEIEVIFVHVCFIGDDIIVSHRDGLAVGFNFKLFKDNIFLKVVEGQIIFRHIIGGKSKFFGVYFFAVKV